MRGPDPTGARRHGRWTPACALVALALVALVLGAPGCAPTPERAVRKTPVATLPAEYRADSITFSEAGDAFAFVVAVDDGERVVSATGPGPLYTSCGRPLFAPGGTRLFYWAVRRAEDVPDEVLLVADGEPLATGLSVPGRIVFADRGRHWAAIGLGPPQGDEPGDLILHVDGREIGRYEDMAVPSFTRDGAHLVTLLARDSGHVVAVVGGEERVRFEPPAAPCAAEARRLARPPDVFARHRIAPLADGTVLSVTRDADGWGVYRDGTRLAGYGLATSDDAREECRTGTVLLVPSVVAARAAPVAVWWERHVGADAQWRMVRDGQPLDDVRCDDFFRAQPPEVGPMGTHVAYGCVHHKPQAESDLVVVHDDARHGPYRELWGIALSEDGTHVAYGAAEGPDRERPWALYVDGEPRTARYGAVWRPRLSPSAAHLAWQAQLEQGGRAVLGVDRWRLGVVDDVVWGPIFEGDRRVSWVVRRGRRLVRIDVALDLLAARRASPAAG